MTSIKKFLLIILIFFAQFAYAQEEFTGPFTSWSNVVTRFHAKGDGKTDDTRALQNALDNLSNPVTGFNIHPERGYMVVYLPKGTYRISRTLVLRGKIGVSFIGEDPVNTIIKWDGADNDTMFWANGSAYFKISRLTWDANNKKGIEGIGIHWKDRWNDATGQSFASLNIELSDLVFNGTAIGIGGGTGSGGTNSNDSEITIRRCTFNQCTEAGIQINGYNALDYWVWYCRFNQCKIAIYCHSGNYHVYSSFFKGSLITDIWNENGYYHSVRGCLSSGSRVFSWDNGMSCNPFKRIFQGNTILQPEEMTIGYYHLGSVTMIDNVIGKSRKPAVKQHLGMRSWCPGNYTTLSLNNKYSYTDPILLETPNKRIFSYNDSVKNSDRTEASFLNSFPSVPRAVSRKIFTVPRNASADAIQEIINEASRLKGSRPVVHFPFGKYTIDRTIIIPAETDMQLIGDGLLYASVLLKKNGRTGFPLFLVQGPSYISIRDLQLGDAGGTTHKSALITFQNIDQRSSTAFVDQLYSLADTSIFINGLNHLYLEKNNSFFSTGNFIAGGSLQKEGKGTLQVNAFGGQFAKLTVLNNASFVAKDCWWEGPKGMALDLNGYGNVTIDGAMIAPSPADSTAAISIKNFRGKVSLLNMYVQGALDILPLNDQLQIMVWNVHYYHKLNPLAFIRKGSSYQGLFFGISAQCFESNGRRCTELNPFTVAEAGVNIENRKLFVMQMTEGTRTAMPKQQQKSSPGISNIYISRITVGMANKGIEFINK